jgi:hypothetical protein
VDRREEHRQLLAVVGVLSPVGAHRMSFELLFIASNAQVSDRDGRKVVDAFGT